MTANQLARDHVVLHVNQFKQHRIKTYANETQDPGLRVFNSPTRSNIVKKCSEALPRNLHPKNQQHVYKSPSYQTTHIDAYLWQTDVINLFVNFGIQWKVARQMNYPITCMQETQNFLA